jgi:hypothetical protein
VWVRLHEPTYKLYYTYFFQIKRTIAPFPWVFFYKRWVSGWLHGLALRVTILSAADCVSYAQANGT